MIQSGKYSTKQYKYMYFILKNPIIILVLLKHNLLSKLELYLQKTKE
jgi:hypothetical protein